MCISAGQRIERTEIFSGRLLTEVREVSLARRKLDPIIEAAVFRVGATPVFNELTAIPNTISFADSAFANPATLMCEMPPLPVLIPPLPELEQEQRTTLELPPFQLSDLREYFSVITFLTPGSAIKGPLSEPEDEARVTIGDEEELKPALQAIDWLAGNNLWYALGGATVFFVALEKVAIVLGKRSHDKALQRERDRREALRTLLLDGAHAFSYDEMRPALHDTLNNRHVSHFFTENITMLTNSVAYQNPRDPEHAKVLVRVLVERFRGLQAKMTNPEIQRPAAAKELDELQQLVATPEFESSFSDYDPLANDFFRIGITPGNISPTTPTRPRPPRRSAPQTNAAPQEARIDRLRANAAAQRAQEAGSPAKAKAGKSE